MAKSTEMGVRYYDDRIKNYDTLEKLYSLDESLLYYKKKNKELFKGTKFHKDLIGYAVNLDVDLLFKDQDFTIKSDNEEIEKFLNYSFYKSNLDMKKSTILKDFCLFGECFLKVEDDAENNTILIKHISPYYVKELIKDSVGNIKKIVIEYPKIEEEEGEKKQNYYKEVYTKENFAIYKNDKEIRKNTNVFNVIPIAHIYIKQNATDYFAESPFINKVGLIETFSESFSLALACLKYNIDPRQTISGSKEALMMFKSMNKATGGNIDLSNGNNTLVLPSGVELKQLQSQGIDASYMDLLKNLTDSIKEDLCEFSLEKAKGQNSSLALQMLLFPLESKIKNLKTAFKGGFNNLVEIVLIIAKNKGLINVDIVKTEWDLKMGEFFNVEKTENFEMKQKEINNVITLFKEGIYEKEEVRKKLQEIEIKYKI